MRYLIFFFIFLSVDAFADGYGLNTEACRYNYRNLFGYSGYEECSTDYWTNPHIPRLEKSVSENPDLVFMGTVRRGKTYCQVMAVNKNDCANSPSDDTEESGCYPDEVDPITGYCSDTTECESGGLTFHIPKGANCSDYCRGPGNGEGKIHACTGQPGEDPLDQTDEGWAESECEAMRALGKLCTTDHGTPGCIWVGNNNGGPFVGTQRCREGVEPEIPEPPWDGVQDPDYPDDCSDAFHAIKQTCILPGSKITLVSAQACTFRCNPPSTNPGDGNPNPGGDDNSGPGTGDGDGGDDGDNGDGNDSGGDSGDDNDNSNGGGGDPDDDEPQQGDPLSIDGFDSLQEKVAAKRQEYLDEFDEYRAKFADLIDLSPNNAGSPFEDNYVELFGVQVNFGTAILEPGLRYLPSIILFCAVFTGACIVLGGPKS